MRARLSNRSKNLTCLCLNYIEPTLIWNISLSNFFLYFYYRISCLWTLTGRGCKLGLGFLLRGFLRNTVLRLRELMSACISHTDIPKNPVKNQRLYAHFIPFLILKWYNLVAVLVACRFFPQIYQIKSLLHITKCHTLK